MQVIVPVSGGKDSQAVLSLALKQGCSVVAVHQNTGYDHPKTYEHIKNMEKFYSVPVTHTVNRWGGMFGWLETAAYFPNSAARGCTQRLKQEPFARWLLESNFNAENCEIWFGMRADESAARANKYGLITFDDEFTLGDVAKFYNQGKRKHLGQIAVRLPIVNWTTKDVFAHLENEQAPINPLYKNHSRVGCYPCFLARKAEWFAAGKDAVGREHIQRLIDLEEHWNRAGNSRKFIKVHRAWDVRMFLQPQTMDMFDETDEQECGWCSI